MGFEPTAELEAEAKELLTRYPAKRSASLMLLHAIQERHGFVSRGAIEWTAKKLELKPINVFELVTFYPMFRQAPPGKFIFKICRTLSCALGGSYELHQYLCEKFGLDPKAHGIQTTADGRFSVEFVECLAGCGSAPTMMLNDDYFEKVTREKLDQLVGQCQKAPETKAPGERN